MIATASVLSVTEAAERRRSIRAFEPGPIPREDLTQILEVVRLAPSAFNIQPWRFIAVETPELKAQLASAAYNQRQVLSAPAVIVLYTDMADALDRVDELLHPGMDATQKEGVKAASCVRVPAIVAIGKGAEEGFEHHRHSVSRISSFV